MYTKGTSSIGDSSSCRCMVDQLYKASEIVLVELYALSTIQRWDN